MTVTLCTEDTMHTVWAADTTEDMKRIFHKIHDDCKVMLQLEKKLFDFFNREVFRDKNTTMTENLQKNWLREFHQVSCFSGCCLLVPPAPLGSAAGPQLLILTSLCWWCCFRAVRPAERRCRHHLEVPVGTPRREAGVDAGFMSQLSACMFGDVRAWGCSPGEKDSCSSDPRWRPRPLSSRVQRPVVKSSTHSWAQGSRFEGEAGQTFCGSLRARVQN